MQGSHEWKCKFRQSRQNTGQGHYRLNIGNPGAAALLARFPRDFPPTIASLLNIAASRSDDYPFREHGPNRPRSQLGRLLNDPIHARMFGKRLNQRDGYGRRRFIAPGFFLNLHANAGRPRGKNDRRRRISLPIHKHNDIARLHAEHARDMPGFFRGQHHFRPGPLRRINETAVFIRRRHAVRLMQNALQAAARRAGLQRKLCRINALCLKV